jgi:hypothetical protein
MCLSNPFIPYQDLSTDLLFRSALITSMHILSKLQLRVSATAVVSSSALSKWARQASPSRHCAVLSGASLASRFWPYAFYHFLRLHNMTIHGDRVKIPYELYSGRKPDLSRLRTFGCRVYVEPPCPRRSAKSEIDARIGIFLGYA